MTALLRRVTPRGAVTALSVIQFLDMMSAGHVVIALGLLHLRRLQRWFIRLRIDPVRQSTLCTYRVHGVHSSFRGFGFNLLEKSPRLVSGGAPEQSDVTHRSVHRRISRRLRNVHVAGRGGTVAGSHVSPYKRAGITLRMESNPAFFRPVAVQSTCVDSNRQQSSGGLHKSPGRCTISAAASHTRASYTAKWTAFHLVCREKPGPHYGHPASHAVVPPAVTGQELAYGTVKTYAAAISSCHIGFGDRDSDLCHALWRLNGIWL